MAWLLVFIVKARVNNKIKRSLILLFKLLLVFLTLRFYTTNILLFYLFFEAIRLSNVKTPQCN
jgi:hypothetical protein